MRLGERGAARRALVCVVAVALCCGPALTGARAQDAAPSDGSSAIASSGETVLLRERPGYDATVLASLSDGSGLAVNGEPVSATDGSLWLPVVANGQSGFVPAGYVAADGAAPADPAAASIPASDSAAADSAAPDPATAAPQTGAATTNSDANLRAAPSGDAEVLSVLPTGTSVAIDGAAENGFVPVSGESGSGWIAADLLTSGDAALPPPLVMQPDGSAAPETTAAPAPTPAPAAEDAEAPASSAPESEPTAGKSTGIAWPFTGGTWQVVQGYNNGTHTNRSAFATYKYSLDWARADGKTAGQPVSAPVSGTIQWIDRGSGGMLVDAGNGYGVAVFHVTLNRGLSQGDQVERGQQIGEISGPGGDGYMEMAHIELACWKLTGNGHESVPFAGKNAIAGQEFPDTGGTNQYMGSQVTP
jgi:murein DD-endopeptidase MepM/ murein hydrolase activator NlpD